ncbi:ATP-dependent DNA helicase MER3 [Coemansia nantahalensis]|uniref:ATP-dependent DNA helicase MER3 n=1 Tax=Coemansia nantahalensis TaxID=2789366 RepID=A0ACC1K5G5_9FUNG|nr:ATP-dependent DNA helicase MER3 [Coemansia nantahalensis]
MDCPPPTPATADSQPLLAEAVAFFAEPGLGHPPPPVVRTGTTSCHFANKRPRLLAAPPQAAVGEDPVPVDRLPPAFAAGYPFSCFNRLQSACFADLFHADSSMVISAPTASGKTVLMEIAICKLFGAEGAENAAIALYLAPLKALCAEKAAEWSARFRQRGLVCVEATAGSESGAERDAAGPSAIQQLGKAHIVCATPEKWISLARHQDLAPGILDRVSLVLIDECHMVGTSRGPQLELAVAGVRMHNARVRIIAASATVRNIGDISRWLGGTGLGQAPAKTLVFGDEYRPVPLTKTVLGFECHAAYYRFQRNLDFKLPGIINAHCPGSLVLVFCSTRGAAQESGYEEYASYEVLQFIGRAGRPQFGTIGKAIVLTETHRVGFYRNLVSGQETLESR